MIDFPSNPPFLRLLYTGVFFYVIKKKTAKLAGLKFIGP